MNYGDPATTWAVWSHDNADRDEDTRLAALKEYIYQAFSRHVAQFDISAEWANKKLTKLGIPERVETVSSYTMEVPVAGVAAVTFAAANRFEAAELARKHFSYDHTPASLSKPSITGPVNFTAGPLDPDPAVVDPDAPATVDDLLFALREVAMLGHLAGPKYCAYGVNRVLADFGLAAIPETKTFRVEVPVTAVAVTEVKAYDEDSAARVAQWRWNDSKATYRFDQATETGSPAVVDPTGPVPTVEDDDEDDESPDA